MTLVKHLLKRKKQAIKAMETLEDLPKRIKGVWRDSERSRSTHEDLYPQTQEAQRKRKKKKKGK